MTVRSLIGSWTPLELPPTLAQALQQLGEKDLQRHGSSDTPSFSKDAQAAKADEVKEQDLAAGDRLFIQALHQQQGEKDLQHGPSCTPSFRSWGPLESERDDKWRREAANLGTEALAASLGIDKPSNPSSRTSSFAARSRTASPVRSRPGSPVRTRPCSAVHSRSPSRGRRTGPAYRPTREARQPSRDSYHLVNAESPFSLSAPLPDPKDLVQTVQQLAETWRKVGQSDNCATPVYKVNGFEQHHSSGPQLPQLPPLPTVNTMLPTSRLFAQNGKDDQLSFRETDASAHRCSTPTVVTRMPSLPTNNAGLGLLKVSNTMPSSTARSVNTASLVTGSRPGSICTPSSMASGSAPSSIRSACALATPASSTLSGIGSACPSAAPASSTLSGIGSACASAAPASSTLSGIGSACTSVAPASPMVSGIGSVCTRAVPVVPAKGPSSLSLPPKGPSSLSLPPKGPSSLTLMPKGPSSLTLAPAGTRSLSGSRGPSRGSVRRSQSLGCLPLVFVDALPASMAGRCTPGSSLSREGSTRRRAASAMPNLNVPYVYQYGRSNTPQRKLPAMPTEPAAELFKRLLSQLPALPHGRSSSAAAAPASATPQKCALLPPAAAQRCTSASEVRRCTLAMKGLARSSSEYVRCSRIVPLKRCISAGQIRLPARPATAPVLSNGGHPADLQPPAPGVCLNGTMSAFELQKEVVTSDEIDHIQLAREDIAKAAAAATATVYKAPTRAASPSATRQMSPQPGFSASRMPLTPRARWQQRIEANARHRPMVKEATSPGSNSAGSVLGDEVFEL